MKELYSADVCSVQKSGSPRSFEKQSRRKRKVYIGHKPGRNLVLPKSRRFPRGIWKNLCLRDEKKTYINTCGGKVFDASGNGDAAIAISNMEKFRAEVGMFELS